MHESKSLLKAFQPISEGWASTSPPVPNLSCPSSPSCLLFLPSSLLLFQLRWHNVFLSGSAEVQSSVLKKSCPTGLCH